VGEFLVMAATLIHIKSKMLLPRPESAEDGEPDEDPREALVRRLLEHQKFKAAAELLHERAVLRGAQWIRPDGRMAEIAGPLVEAHQHGGSCERRVRRQGDGGTSSLVIHLSLHELSVNFGGLRAVDRVTFSIEVGEIRGLIGPNGAGKTTIFNCITGFYRPTSGIIRFRDRDVTHLRPDQIARLGIARTFQNVQLFRSMSALDNVLVARHSHMRTGVLAEGLALPFVHRQERLVRDKAEELMEFLGLVDVKRQTAGNLPLGSQKRLELARALALEPELLLEFQRSAPL